MTQATQLKKAVFLDRDGTLIIDRVYLNDPDQITYLDGAFEAMIALQKAGYELVIVTNQSGVARGLVTLENLHEIHRRIETTFAEHGVRFAGIYYAPYSVESEHELRKPKPGMLTTAARELSLDLASSWMVGDRMTDVEAGHRAGCRTVLLEGQEDPAKSPFAAPEHTVASIMAAANAILSQPETRR